MNAAHKYKQTIIFALSLVTILLFISFTQLQALPTGTYNTYLPIILDYRGLSTTTIVPYSASWKYLDDGTEPETDWTSISFDDSNWKSGFAEFGYGDGDENTEINFGPDSNAKQITTYFRRAFTVDNISDYKSLQLHLLRDDGAVVYLNGNELVRSNMPAGNIISTTLALSPIFPPAEKSFHIQNISHKHLLDGENVLAVEIHQVSPTSSDVSFNLTLVGTAVPPKPIRFAAIGDYGWDHPSQQEVANLIQGWEPDIIITVGDNSYGSTPIDQNIGKNYSGYIHNYSGIYGAGSPVNRFFPTLGG